MYLSHFNLREKPFKVSTDPKFLWLGERQKEALAAIRYGILYGDGYVVLTGDVGTGKTTLAIALVNELSDQLVAARIPYPDFDILDFLRLISSAYGIDNDFSNKAAFRNRFESFLRGCLSTGKKAILIVDEAQKLGQEHLEELMQLSAFEEKGVLFNIVFVGQNEFNDILLEESNRACRQRTAINYHLTPLTETETGQYINHRLKVANGQEEIFSSEAIHEVFLQSGGIPRLINIVCDLALLMTYLEGENCVRAEAVRQGAERLRLPGESPASIVTDSARSPVPEAKVESEFTERKDGQALRGVVKEDAPNWTRNKSWWARGESPMARGKLLWAGGLALGVVLLGLVLLFYLGERDRTFEVSNEKVSQGYSTTRAETKPSDEVGVGGMTTASPREPTFLREADKVPESSARRKAFGELVKTMPSKKASAQAAKDEGGETARSDPRKTIMEMMREESLSGKTENGLTARRGPSLEDGQETRRQSPAPVAGSSIQDTPERATDEVEPGMVIDWLLEKREKK